MTRISKRPVENNIMDKIYILLFETVGKKSNKNDFFGTLNDILSPTEKIMIGKRVGIMFLLLKNIEYEMICDVLKVSSRTVAKFHFILTESRIIRKSLSSIVTKERILDLLMETWLDLRGPGTYGVNWKSAWRSKLEFQKMKTQGIQ